MEASLSINILLLEAKKLTKEEQLTLLQRLVTLLKKPEPIENNAVQLSSLAGLGSGLWGSTNEIDNYLEEERQW